MLVLRLSSCRIIASGLRRVETQDETKRNGSENPSAAEAIMADLKVGRQVVDSMQDEHLMTQLTTCPGHDNDGLRRLLVFYWESDHLLGL